MSQAVNNLLSIDGLCCERGGVSLFRNLDFHITSGELLQLIGPNGCGKTTLLRLLAGLGEASAGQIHRRTNSMFYLGHRHAMKARLSPLENLAWYFPEASEQDVLAALKQWRLSGYENLRCEQLSAGQQQRVALARLTLSNASLYLLDEPFTAIDTHGVEQLEQCLVDKAKQGSAVLFTSHHQFSHTDRLRVLNLINYAR